MTASIKDPLVEQLEQLGYTVTCPEDLAPGVDCYVQQTAQGIHPEFTAPAGELIPVTFNGVKPRPPRQNLSVELLKSDAIMPDWRHSAFNFFGQRRLIVFPVLTESVGDTQYPCLYSIYGKSHESGSIKDAWGCGKQDTVPTRRNGVRGDAVVITVQIQRLIDEGYAHRLPVVE